MQRINTFLLLSYITPLQIYDYLLLIVSLEYISSNESEKPGNIATKDHLSHIKYTVLDCYRII